MSASDAHEAVAQAFAAQRERLVAVAHRILGSRADAEDAVQEAWLRLARQERDTIDNLACSDACLRGGRRPRAARQTPITCPDTCLNDGRYPRAARSSTA